MLEKLSQPLKRLSMEPHRLRLVARERDVLIIMDLSQRKHSDKSAIAFIEIFVVQYLRWSRGALQAMDTITLRR